MKQVLFAGWILRWALSALGADWYESLRPGVTRTEVLKITGVPTSSDADLDTYKQAQGRIECNYHEGVLQSLVYYDTPSGASEATEYRTEGQLNAADLAARKAYLARKSFAVLPTLPGRTVYTAKYSGTCYELDGEFIVIEPIIFLLGGQGYFADKVARVLLVDRVGRENVLYLAADNWSQLRPPGVSEKQVQTRRAKLAEAREAVAGRGLAGLLGECDSHMGSGIDYRLYYLDNALAVVRCNFSNRTEIVAGVYIEKPGWTNLTLGEWLDSSQSASPNAAPQHR
jgi:hypothetical protein